MSKNTSSRRGGKKSSRWKTTEELSPNEIVCPVDYVASRCRAGKTEELLHTIRLGYDQAAQTDGSGVMATVFSNAVAGAQNWTNYASVFDSYRVLGMIVEYDPFWTVNTTFAPIASVVDRSDGTALTSYGLAERYESHKKVPGKKEFRQVANMTGSEDSDFLPTSNSTATSNWIKMYSSGNTASQTIGRYNVSLLVQFRGVGIN